MDYSKRVKLTTSCRDTDYIPKVDDAGSIKCEDDIKYQVMHNGVKVVYGGYHGEWMAEIIKKLKGHHEPQEEKVFYEILKEIKSGATMLELGSYWAYYSAWFNKSIEGAKNYLVEPNLRKIEIGKENFKLNSMDGIFFNAFIGEKSNEKSVFTDWDGKQSTIPMVCIDDFMRDNDISFLDILHSDIQGAELDMLKGAKNALSGHKIGYLVLSTHGHIHKPCRSLLSEYGYKIIADHTPQESASADGLLAAQSPLLKEMPKISISRNNVGSMCRLKNLFSEAVRSAVKLR